VVDQWRVGYRDLGETISSSGSAVKLTWKKAGLLDGWSLTFITNASCLALGVITGVMAARGLLPAGRGQLATILYWGSLIGAIGTWSIPEALAARTAKGLKESTLVPAALTLGAVLSIAVVAASTLILPHLLDASKASLRHLGSNFLGAFLPCYIFMMILLGSDQGALRTGRYNSVRLLTALIVLIGYVGSALADSFTVETAIYVNLASVLLPTIILLIGSSKASFAALPTLHEIGNLFKLGSGFHISAVLVIISSQLDKITVLRYCDAVDVGIYAVAFTYASSGLTVITNSFFTMTLPELARASAANKSAQYLEHRLAVAATMLYAGTTLLLVLGKALIPFLFGAAYSRAWLVSCLLSVAYMPLALRQIIIRALRGIGMWGMGVVCEAGALVLFTVIIQQVKSVTLVTIAIALAISNILILAILAAYLKVALSVAPSKWLLPSFVALQVMRARTTSLLLHMGRRSVPEIVK